MAGTLVISTLSDGTNSTSSTNCIQGSAKAWVNFNGGGGAGIRASYNISSVVRNSQGYYTVNFTNAMVDANYSYYVVSSNDQNASFSGYGYPININRSPSGFVTPTTSAFSFWQSWSASGYADPSYCNIAVFR